MKYLTTDEVISINKKAVEKIKVKKADRHEVSSYDKLNKALEKCESYKGNTYNKSACLVYEIAHAHAFASANRRTAFLSAKSLLKRNKIPSKVGSCKTHGNILTMIREGKYTNKEVSEWLKNDKIKKIER